MTLFLSEAELDALLAEDVPNGDLTTRLLGISSAPALMHFSMRAEAVVSGIEIARRLIERRGGRAQVLIPSGLKVPAGTPILTAHGSAGALHAAWKVSQTLVEYLSGIATAAAAVVAAAHAVAPDVAVVTTRKTFPGVKRLMISAIRDGGAEVHRLGLSETLLVFAEHRAFLSDPVAAIAGLRLRAPEKKVVVEVSSPEEAAAVLAARPDILQCEKMTPPVLGQVVRLAAEEGGHTQVAAAGGVNAANAADYVRAGARILVTSAPYWAKPCDVKVVLEPGAP